MYKKPRIGTNLPALSLKKFAIESLQYTTNLTLMIQKSLLELKFIRDKDFNRRRSSNVLNIKVILRTLRSLNFHKKKW